MKQGVFGIALTTGIPSPSASWREPVETPAAIESPLRPQPLARLRHVLRLEAEDDDVGFTDRFGVVRGADEPELARELLGGLASPGGAGELRGLDLSRAEEAPRESATHGPRSNDGDPLSSEH
jgi:hypothetical protein